MTGSAFSTSAACDANAFSIVKGETVIGGLHGAIRHRFCAHCMSWVYTQPEGIDTFVNVRLTLFDEPAHLPPFLETYTCEKLPWVNVPAVRSYEKFPPFEDYGMLAEAYSAYYAD